MTWYLSWNVSLSVCLYLWYDALLNLESSNLGTKLLFVFHDLYIINFLMYFFVHPVTEKVDTAFFCDYFENIMRK